MKTSVTRSILPAVFLLLVSNLAIASPPASSTKPAPEVEMESDWILRSDTGLEIKLPKPDAGQTEISAQSSRVEEGGRMEFSGNVHIKITSDDGAPVEISCEKVTITPLNIE